MAVNTRTAAPQYKIYEPDSLDVALSQKVLDPLQGGIAGALLMNHRAETDQNIDRFTADQDRFNKMAAGLDAMEINQKGKEARTKLIPGMMEHGVNARDILGIEDLLTPGGIQSNDAATLFGDKTRAEIAAALAKANADNNGPKDTYQVTYEPPGQNRAITETRKGRSGMIPEMTIGKGGPPNANPTSSTPVPPPANGPANLQQQISLRAKGALGTDAVMLKQREDGATLWASPGTKKTAVFDAQGKMVRQ